MERERERERARKTKRAGEQQKRESNSLNLHNVNLTQRMRSAKRGVQQEEKEEATSANIMQTVYSVDRGTGREQAGGGRPAWA